MASLPVQTCIFNPFFRVPLNLYHAPHRQCKRISLDFYLFRCSIHAEKNWFDCSLRVLRIKLFHTYKPLLCVFLYVHYTCALKSTTLLFVAAHSDATSHHRSQPSQRIPMLWGLWSACRRAECKQNMETVDATSRSNRAPSAAEVSKRLLPIHDVLKSI